MRTTRVRILALLLLADGAPVAATRLRSPFPSGRTITQSSLKERLRELRALGCRIERIQRRPRLAYRLLAVPPDALLEDLLTIVHEIRSSERRAPIPIAARTAAAGASSRPSATTATPGTARTARASGW